MAKVYIDERHKNIHGIKERGAKFQWISQIPMPLIFIGQGVECKNFQSSKTPKSIRNAYVISTCSPLRFLMTTEDQSLLFNPSSAFSPINQVSIV